MLMRCLHPQQTVPNLVRDQSLIGSGTGLITSMMTGLLHGQVTMRYLIVLKYLD